MVSPSHISLNLEGPRTTYVWAPGDNMAQCSECQLGLDENCTCGIYSLKTPAHDLIHYHPDIVGEVVLWGKIIEGDIGYRAKHAMVSLFLLPSVLPMSEEDLNRLSLRYNAPLVKADGQILKAISVARRKILINRGQLDLVARQQQYKRDWGWMGRSRMRSGEGL